MPPRDEEYVESAAIDDESIDGEEDVSDDSDEYHALPSLPVSYTHLTLPTKA